MIFIILNILLVITVLYLIFYKKIELENFILENMIFIYIFLEYGFVFLIFYLFTYFIDSFSPVLD